jgi:hypothetical protein
MVEIERSFPVNAVAHCMLAEHADTFTHVSQSMWESRL